MKKLIVGIIIGLVLALTINIVGASISSSGVMYNSKTLNTVLDDLYSKIEEINNTGDASSSNILIGKTALVKGTKLTGSMANKAGTTTTATKVTESGSNALITIPTNGYYSTSSKISVPISTIESNISLLNTNTFELIGQTSNIRYYYYGTNTPTVSINTKNKYNMLLIDYVYKQDTQHGVYSPVITVNGDTQIYKVVDVISAPTNSEIHHAIFIYKSQTNNATVTIDVSSQSNQQTLTAYAYVYGIK